MPHDSPGLRWEIETLMGLRSIPKVLFLMPPESATFDARSLWKGAAAVMRDQGLALPEYRPDGLIFRLETAGSVAESIPFDTIWHDTLFARIEHLLPSDAGRSRGSAEVN
jgi:hypothetical protein